MRVLPPLLLTIFLSGCIATVSPINNMEFKQMESYQDIDGIYDNNDNGSKTGGMTWLISQTAPKRVLIDAVGLRETSYKRNGFVKVVSTDKKIVFSEYSDNKRMNTINLIKGEDFILKDGGLLLHEGFIFSDVFAGFNWSSYKIGLDRSGNLKYSSREWAVGLAYLLFPLAFWEQTEMIFNRVGEK